MVPVDASGRREEDITRRRHDDAWSCSRGPGLQYHLGPGSKSTLSSKHQSTIRGIRVDTRAMTFSKLIILGESPKGPEEQIDLTIHSRSMEIRF